MNSAFRTGIAAIGLITAMSCIAGCEDRARSSGSGSPAGGPSSPPPTTLTGTLQSGAAAIGGETTGWRIVGDGATGGFDVDVSRLQPRAKSLDGQRVTVTGKMTSKNWPERGPTQVLVAERIEPAAPPGRK